jgi:hypothetical protein
MSGGSARRGRGPGLNSEILQAIEALSDPGDVREVRALKNGTTAAGYFDNATDLAREAAKLDEQGFTVYVTANPALPALLARAENRIRRPLKATTSDRDVVRRRWLPVDFDPVRPTDVSSTAVEKEAAFVRAREVRAYLRVRGWPEPVAGDSGNGYHLLYSVDLPNDAESLELVRGVRVSVDTTTSNAARIWKLYGTTARKGDSTKDRPHRLSRLLNVPEERGLLSLEQLRSVAATKPEPRKRGLHMGTKDYPAFDLASWIAEHGVLVRSEGPCSRATATSSKSAPGMGTPTTRAISSSSRAGLSSPAVSTTHAGPEGTAGKNSASTTSLMPMSTDATSATATRGTATPAMCLLRGYFYRRWSRSVCGGSGTAA